MLEQVKKNESDRAWSLEILQEVKLIVDSYEQSIQRPTDNEEQKKNYSDKQNRHTKKNQVIVMPSGKEIVDVVVGETGATADINIWRKQRLSLLTSQNFQGNKAYALDRQLTILRTVLEQGRSPNRDKKSLEF
ncbi:transposase family protein [Microcoleus sp. F4-D5]|uniref:transposase family protein n=1 Tax=Microcoleus sp. F4-D5 TaxID=2818760 RepID=UPI002FD288E7